MNNLDNLGPIMIVTLFGLRILAIPVGFAVFWLVRRMMPVVTAITTALMAGFVIGFVVLFSALRVFAWEAVGLYDAAAIALVVTSALVLVIAYGVKQYITRTAPPSDAQEFGVWGESARSRPRNLRRIKRR
jgi:hypothetical protein